MIIFPREDRKVVFLKKIEGSYAARFWLYSLENIEKLGFTKMVVFLIPKKATKTRPTGLIDAKGWYMWPPWILQKMEVKATELWGDKILKINGKLHNVQAQDSGMTNSVCESGFNKVCIPLF